jgi:hypothetical protein
MQPMVAPGVEFAFGMVTDPLFGPVLVLAAGGVAIESLDDFESCLPGVDAAGANRMIDRLSISKRLESVRGGPPLARARLVESLIGFSALVASLGEMLHSVDVNPVVVGYEDAVAVDCLVSLRPVDSGSERRSSGDHDSAGARTR